MLLAFRICLHIPTQNKQFCLLPIRLASSLQVSSPPLPNQTIIQSPRATSTDWGWKGVMGNSVHVTTSVRKHMAGHKVSLSLSVSLALFFIPCKISSDVCVHVTTCVCVFVCVRAYCVLRSAGGEGEGWW